MQPKRILVVKLSAIGDTIHALPAVAALRDRFPDSRIDWCVENRCVALVKCFAPVDQVIRLHTRRWRKGRQLVGSGGLLEFFRTIRAGRYDLGIDFQGLIKSGVVLRLSGAPVRLGWAPARLREPRAASFYTQALDGISEQTHVIDWCAALLRPLGITDVPWRFPITLPEAAVARAGEVLAELGGAEFVLVNPGAGWPTKQWAPASFGRLSSRIVRETGRVVLISHGPGEEPLVEAVRRECTDARPTRLNLQEFAALAKRAACFVGGDTGPMHIASAVGAPVVALFGPTDPRRNGPFQREDIVLHRELPCSGSYRRRCPDAAHRCMNFTVDEVFDAVRRRLGSEGSSVGH